MHDTVLIITQRYNCIICEKSNHDDYYCHHCSFVHDYYSQYGFAYALQLRKMLSVNDEGMIKEKTNSYHDQAFLIMYVR